MIRVFLWTVAGTLIGAGTGYLLAEGLVEGAFVGALLGGSLGVTIAMRLASGGTDGPDDNLITTARRNLIREAYYDTFDRQPFDEKIERLGSANQAERKAQAHDLQMPAGARKRKGKPKRQRYG